MRTNVRAEYEKYADPRAKYVSHKTDFHGLSLTYQVDGYPHQSKSYFEFEGRFTLRDAAQEIGKSVLSDVAA